MRAGSGQCAQGGQSIEMAQVRFQYSRGGNALQQDGERGWFRIGEGDDREREPGQIAFPGLELRAEVAHGLAGAADLVEHGHDAAGQLAVVGSVQVLDDSQSPGGFRAHQQELPMLVYQQKAAAKTILEEVRKTTSSALPWLLI